MPYITAKDKPQYGAALAQLANQLKGQPKGHLTYVLYVLAKRFIPEQRYTAMSDTRACIGDAYDEFYRTIMAPYEEEQRKINGDVE